MAILELKNIAKKFNDSVVINKISMFIENSEFFTIFGPSRCGKTTILRMIGYSQKNEQYVFKAYDPETRRLVSGYWTQILQK